MLWGTQHDGILRQPPFISWKEEQMAGMCSTDPFQHHYCSMGTALCIGSTDLIPYAMLTVGIGEILAIGVLGNILLVTLERHYKAVLFAK